MRILVVGAQGFLGSEVVRQAKLRGWSVHAANRREPVSVELFTPIQAGKFSVVINVAAATYRQPETRYLPEYLEANVQLPSHLRKACANAGTVLLQTGTRWSIGESGEGPNSLYAYTKLWGDQLLIEAVNEAKERGLAAPYFGVIYLRDVMGPKDSRRKLFNQLLNAGLSGGSLDMTSGHQLIDPCDVRDVAESLLDLALEALESPSSLDHRYEIVHGPMKVRQFVDFWFETLGYRVPIQWGALEHRGTELHQMHQVYSRLHTFFPRPLQSSILDTAQAFVANLEMIEGHRIGNFSGR